MTPHRDRALDVVGSAAVSAEHSNSTPRADTLEDVYSMLAAHCTPAYRFKGGVPALGESPAPLVRVRAHILESNVRPKRPNRATPPPPSTLEVSAETAACHGPARPTQEKPLGTIDQLCMAMLQLEGQGLSTKTHHPPSAVFSAETASTRLRVWDRRAGLSNLDPPVERPRIPHICVTLDEPSIWWPSMELTWWFRAACESLLGQPFSISLLRRILSLRLIKDMYEEVPPATRAAKIDQI